MIGAEVREHRLQRTGGERLEQDLDAFRDRVDQLSALNSALELDLTGPWPPYDFVTMATPPPIEPPGALRPANGR